MHAELKVDFSAALTATNNLQLDSSRLQDLIGTTAMGTRWYPTSRTEIGLVIESTDYLDYQYANSFRVNLGIMQILSRSDGLARSFLEVRVDDKSYRGEARILNSTTISGTFAWTSKPGSSYNYRLGIRSHVKDYPNASHANDWRVEFYTGLNLSLPGRNSVDIEAGAGLIGLQAIDAPFGFVNPNDPLAQLRDTGLTTVYISPRWSRPLGPRTGIAIQFTQRWPIRGRSLTVYGFSSGYLSPWANAFYGSELTMNIKTLKFTPATIDSGVGLSRRYYLFILNDPSALIREETRWDYHGIAYVSGRFPLRIYGNTSLDVSLSVQYIMNSSTFDLYSYSAASASVGIIWTP